MVNDSELTLDQVREQVIANFFKTNYYRDFIPISARYLDLSLASGRALASTPSYETFKVPSDEVRNAKEHTARASIIEGAMIERFEHEVREGGGLYEDWILPYIAKYRSIEVRNIAKRIILSEIAMSIWHLDVGKMQMLTHMLEDLKDMLRLTVEFAFEAKGAKTDEEENIEKEAERRKLEGFRRSVETDANALLDDLGQLQMKPSRPPTPEEIKRTADIVARQNGLITDYMKLLKHWRTKYSVPSFAQVRAWHQRRVRMLFVTCFGPLAFVVILAAALQAKYSGVVSWWLFVVAFIFCLGALFSNVLGAFLYEAIKSRLRHPNL